MITPVRHLMTDKEQTSLALITFNYIHHSSSMTEETPETRHRYPWICSVRSREVSPQHYCAVTLFSRPPAPTVLVGPAHCTYLCKSSRDEVDNCCCGGQNDCSEDIPRCGNLPKVVEMTGKVPSLYIINIKKYL